MPSAAFARCSTRRSSRFDPVGVPAVQKGARAAEATFGSVFAVIDRVNEATFFGETLTPRGRGGRSSWDGWAVWRKRRKRGLCGLDLYLYTAKFKGRQLERPR
jgi:hypothetical protein